ncbi:MAG: ACT domain-containing protein, partial [Desulfurococcaceae archaeon]
MKIKELVKVDSKGRITIPLSVREAFDIREGMNLLVVADTDEKSITLSPVPEKAKLVEIIVRVEDRPGVLATISRSLADNGVDIVFIKCGVIRRGELGECTIIADVA